MTSISRLNILQRINAVMKEVTYIQKDKKPNMRYSIVSHDVVTAKLRPSIVNHGIVYWPMNITVNQTGNRCECWGFVRFCAIDDPNDYIDVYSAGYGIDEQDKGPGKAISYLVKYALLKVFGLETGDDPDLDQNVELVDNDDPHQQNISDFNTKVQAATTVADLEAVVKNMGAYIKDAEAKWPGKVAAARTAYASKLATLKQKEAKS